MMAIKANIPVITLAYGDVYSTLEKKYFINSFDEIADFIKNYNQYDVKDKACKLETLALFNGFSTYFTDFFEKRKNV